MHEISTWLKDTLVFFKGHLRAICAIILPFIIPLNFIYLLIGLNVSEGNADFLWVSLVGLPVYPLYQGALIIYIASVISGKNITRKACYQGALALWLPLFLLSIMTSLALAVGLMLFILPGLYVMARLAFSEFYCVLYRQQALQALQASWRLTKGKEWQILLGGLGLIVINWLPIWLMESLFASLQISHPLVEFVLSVIESILWVNLTIYAFRIFSAMPNKTP